LLQKNFAIYKKYKKNPCIVFALDYSFPVMTNTTNQQNTNNNLVISSYGNGLAVGIEGSREEIEIQFNRFFNHGGAGRFCTEDFCSENGEAGDNYLHFTCDRFAYFLSDDDSMIGAMLNEKLMQANIDPSSNLIHKGKKGGIYNELKENAIQEFSAIKRENFMGFKPSEVNFYQQLDGGAPSWDASSVSLSEQMLM
jgi:hypothetical protein